MKYQYFLSTFDRDGNQISNAVIAGIQSDGDTVVRSVATIYENKIIRIVEGEQPASEAQYVHNQSRAYQMEIKKSGEIDFLEGIVPTE